MKLWPTRDPAHSHPQIEIRTVLGRGQTGTVLATVRCLSNEPRVTYTPDARDLDPPTTSELHRCVRRAFHEIKTLPCTTCGRIPGSSTLRG